MRRRRLGLTFCAMISGVLGGSGWHIGAQEPELPNGRFIQVRPLYSRWVNSPSRDAIQGSNVTPDGRILVFGSMLPNRGVSDENWDYRENFWDLFEARRAGPLEPFGDVRPLDELNSPFADGLGTLWNDGRTLYFSSNRSGDWTIYIAERDDLNESFGIPQPFTALSSEGIIDFGPSISCDGRAIYFAANRPGGQGKWDIWVAALDEPDGKKLGEVIRIENIDPGGLLNINTQYYESPPAVMCDDRTLVFSDFCFWDSGNFGLCSPRAELDKLDDMWLAMRVDGGEPWGSAVNLDELDAASKVLGRPSLNTPWNDTLPSRTYDWPDEGSLFYFTSDRPHPRGRGESDIYQAVWLPSEDITFENEPLRTRGAINCGGLEVDAGEELGSVFEEDRFYGDDFDDGDADPLAWRGSPAEGYVVTQTVLGHERIDEMPADGTRWGILWGVENPRPVDTTRIAGAAVKAAEILSTYSVCPAGLHYRALVEPGRYEVTLYFAEGNPEAISGLGEGRRIVDVTLNGEKVLCNWSAASAAGAETPGGEPGSGDPLVTCTENFGGALLDTAIARTFSLTVGDDNPEDGADAGTLEIIVAPAQDVGSPLPPSLAAFSFEQTGDGTFEPIAGDIECVPVDPEPDQEEGLIEEAWRRWDGGRGSLYINCGGPLLGCSATENPAPEATGDPDPGGRVVWLGDPVGDDFRDPVDNEVFEVIPLNDDTLNVVSTDMGYFDTRGTEKGLDQNDAIFHEQRSGEVQYVVAAEPGTYEVTLYFANPRWETAGTGRCFFRVYLSDWENFDPDAPIEGFEPCPDSPAGMFDTLLDPVDEADRLYAENPCTPLETCDDDPRVPHRLFLSDPDADGVPSHLECGNAAAFALRRDVEVDGGALSIALTWPNFRVEPPPPSDPRIAGISVRRRPPEGTAFVRGNADAKGPMNITDCVFVLNFLFLGGPRPPCIEAANVDGEQPLNITDGVYCLNFLFLGGTPPPAPFPECDTADGADCDAFDACP